MKKIAVINDLSGFGKCSLTAAISVIASMGVQPCPLPTAILSAQSCYPSYFCHDFTEYMDEFRREWKKMHVSFDGIYTGYMAQEYQIDVIEKFLDDFYQKETFLLVDPVLGDAGETYNMFTAGLLLRMKDLIKKADIITPNVTELCLLTGTDYGEIDKIKDKDTLLKILEELARNLEENGPKQVIVTGIRFFDPADGINKMGNLTVSENKSHCFAFPFIGRGYSGTGDLFASVIAGGKARGDSLEEMTELAGKFIEFSIRESVRQKVPENDGVNYEQYLGMLTEMECRNNE